MGVHKIWIHFVIPCLESLIPINLFFKHRTILAGTASLTALCLMMIIYIKEVYYLEPQQSLHELQV